MTIFYESIEKELGYHSSIIKTLYAGEDTISISTSIETIEGSYVTWVKYDDKYYKLESDYLPEEEIILTEIDDTEPSFIYRSVLHKLLFDGKLRTLSP